LKQIIKKIQWLKVAEVLMVITLTMAPVFVAAQTSGIGSRFNCTDVQGLNCSAGTNVNQLIKTVINWALGVTFAIAVLFLIIGGFWYITAGGNEEQADKGKKTIINALIGVVVIILSYVIVNVVTNLVTNTNVGNGA
jgi:hypothetical protein